MRITPEEVKEMIDRRDDFTLLDVRTTEEYRTGFIKGAVLLPDFELEAMAETVLPDKDRLIVVYCRSGARSARAAAKLVRMGYTNIRDLGGILMWPYEVVMH